MLVVGVALARGGQGRSALSASCTKPQLELRPTTLDRGGLVAWAVTGPAADRVVLALDSPRTPTATPLDGPEPLTGCLVRGSVPLVADPGDHTVTAFLLAPDGTATPVRTVDVTLR